VVQDVVLMRALRDMNLPKFVFDDVPLFLGLISDLFPGLNCPRVRYPNFNDAVEEALEKNKYIVLSQQVGLSDSMTIGFTLLKYVCDDSHHGRRSDGLLGGANSRTCCSLRDQC